MIIIKFVYTYFFGAGTPRIRLLYNLAKGCQGKGLTFISNYLQRKIERDYSSYISLNAKIAPSVKFIHPSGVVIGKNVIIEDNVIIFQQVTLGGARSGDWEAGNFPVICKNSTLYAGCKVLGDIKIGEGTVVGANSVVTKSSLNNSVLVGVPAKNIAKMIDD